MFGITKGGAAGGKSLLNKLWWKDSNFRISDWQCVVVSAACSNEEDGFAQWFACRDSGVIVRLLFDWICAQYWTCYRVWRLLNSGCASVGIKQVFRLSEILYAASLTRSFNLALLRAMLTNVWPHKENSGPDLSGSFSSERMHTICAFFIKTQFNASVPHSQHQVLNLSDYNNSNQFFYFVFFF